jgi:chemotaxis methyl-accepting protein methylase
MPVGFDEFLKEVVSPLGLNWRPFHRRGIKRKVERRIVESGLSNFEEYLQFLRKNLDEQRHLSKILAITISRFFRDREVFDTLTQSVIPILLKEDRKELKIWSIGCASGEEPYSLSFLWKERFEWSWPQVHLSILGTDIDEHMLNRAQAGKYKRSSLKEVPEEIFRKFFRAEENFYTVHEVIRKSVEFKRHDLIGEEPFWGMDIIFCRNLAFTYFSKESQIEVLKKIATSLREKGYLVIGKDESLPLTYPTQFVLIFATEKIYQKFI